MSIKGSSGEIPWAVFRDTCEGKCQAIELAEKLVQTPSDLDESRPRVEGCEYTKVYQFRRNKFEVIDWGWAEGHQGLANGELDKRKPN